MKNIRHKIVLFLCTLLVSSTGYAQADILTDARVAVDNKDFGKAEELYKKLYETDPMNQDFYTEYLAVLLARKEYKNAEAVVQFKIGKQKDPLLFIDLGRIYEAAGKGKKAEEQYEKAIAALNGDDMLATRMASAFVGMNKEKYAIRAYEQTRNLLHDPYIFSNQLARLYAKNGETDKAVNTLLDVGPGQMGGIEEIKGTLLELLGTDAKKLQQAQKAFVKRINEQPENIYYSELLTWLYTQKDDWDGAFIQIQALDERNKENGQRLIEFARTAKREEEYATAIKALDAVIEKGKDQPMYAIVKAERLEVMMRKLEADPFFKPEDVARVEKDYEIFFTELPQYNNTETLRDYARLEAEFAGKTAKAIELLENAIALPGNRKDFTGRCKLQLGDYYILAGRIWDASLVYSQVDKASREDVQGEEARFRNAKLAYYRGDFEWAQGQLSVLKASTSELIANDALYLSVLITENIPPDSNYTPLRRFAYADLLLFQNKDNEAQAILDSISQAFPKHPLIDDILMLDARLAQKHRDYTKALSYLRQIYTDHGQDVLGDDAVFKTADIYEKYTKDPAKAKEFYEKLIVDYPGSTYVQTARSRLADLQNSSPVLP